MQDNSDREHDEAIKARLEEFRQTVDAKRAEHYAKNFPSLKPPLLQITEGPRYFKAVNVEHGRVVSVYCFIDKWGQLLKAEGFNKPAKHARGSIFDANCGWGTAVNVHGAAYLR